MVHEVVRPGTLSRALTMQVLLGNAVEVLRLLEAGVVVDPHEVEALRRAAESFKANGSSGIASTSSAISDASVEMVAAVRTALDSESTQGLETSLHSLVEALILVADTGGIAQVKIPVDELIQQLTAIRRALAARTAIATDEAQGLLTA